MCAAVDESTNFDYNWDEISVGDFIVNNSVNFFARNHPEHEPFKNKLPNNISEENEAQPEPNNQIQPESNDAVQQNNFNVGKDDNSTETKEYEEAETIPLKNLNIVHTSPNARPATSQPRVAMAETKEFNVVKFGHIYDAKRKAVQQAIEQREKQQRKFHSHPAPNFNVIHAAADRKRQMQPPKYTVPMTPMVVRRHRETLEKVQKKKEEYEASLQTKPFVSKPADALKKKPFVPQIEKCQITPVPFNLQADARLKERRQFDENKRAEAERKQREKEEEKQLEDERIRREIRKATVFKAHPNPFK